MRKLVLFGLCFLLIHLSLKGSIFSKDSLKKRSDHYDQYLDSIKKMESLRSISPSDCLKFGKEVINMTRLDADPSLIGLAEKTQGVSYYYQGVFDSALYHFNKALPEFLKAKQKLDVGKVWNNIAVIYRRTNKAELALEGYLKAKEIYEEVGYQRGIATIYFNVGGVYHSLENFLETEHYYLMAKSLFEDLDYGARLGEVNMNLGVLYLGQKQYDRALKYLNKSEIFIEEYGTPLQRGELLLNFGEVAFYKKEYKKALSYYDECEAIRIKINDFWGLPKSYVYSAQCLTELERYDEALDKLKKSEDICLEYKLSEDLEKTYLQKSILFEKRKDFEQALFYSKRGQTLKDSLKFDDQTQRLNELEFIHYLDLKEKELEIKNLDLSRKNILLLSLILGIILATAFVLFYIRSKSYRNKLQTLSLEQKVRLSQMNPHFLFNSLSVIQDFILDNNNDKAFNYLSKLSGLVRGVLENSTQDYIYVREELDILSAYIELQNLRFGQGIAYRFDIDSEIDLDEIRIPPMLVQPIIENALVHGELRNNPEAEIKLCLVRNKEANSIDFSIEDNGVGIDIKQKNIGSHKSMGTKILHDRVRIYNYYSKNTLSIDVIDLKTLNKDLHGTRVSFSIPLCQN
ncbi:tetratricopeptide repeat protein [Ancylomarina subtilis]|uniref:Tetratricopeptide repeat protein n=1 Tax=Ancylomarina subtilis TaxID=1639035 RepID=A0A4Q7V7J6_9BACT|nr:tetratricopeptide repeat protein [Ancylomarina subtilis]RZT92355.1 tetratricopeptide repeat protein [Ancylomarina subtilis]